MYISMYMGMHMGMHMGTHTDMCITCIGIIT